MSDRTGVFFREERRKQPSSALVVMVQQIHENVTSLRGELNDGLAAQKTDLQDVLVRAFPEGDAAGHRRHHEAVIKAAEKRAKFWTDMAASVAKWGLVGLVGWMVNLAWQGLLQGPHK